MKVKLAKNITKQFLSYNKKLEQGLFFFNQKPVCGLPLGHEAT